MKILIFVAEMPYSKPAVLFGGLISRLLESSVTMLSVVPEGLDLHNCERYLNQALDLIPKKEAATQLILRDNLTNGILEEIKKDNYDLVILKIRDTLHLLEIFDRKIGRYLAKNPPISILVVKKDQPKLKRILICTSGTEVSTPSIEFGAKLAKAAGAEVTLLHVAIPIPSMYAGLSGAEDSFSELLHFETPLAQHLRHAATILAKYSENANLEISYGVVVEEILREANTGNHDLIILGASQVGKSFSSWALGDVTHEIVDRAHCQVLVFRNEI